MARYIAGFQPEARKYGRFSGRLARSGPQNPGIWGPNRAKTPTETDPGQHGGVPIRIVAGLRQA